jgi:hypothetical protein
MTFAYLLAVNVERHLSAVAPSGSGSMKDQPPMNWRTSSIS